MCPQEVGQTQNGGLDQSARKQEEKGAAPHILGKWKVNM